MATDVTPAPTSTRATPPERSSSVRTVRATTSGRKYFLAIAMPSWLKILSKAVVAVLLPTNTLKLPSKLEESVPTTSSSTSWMSLSMEKDWATAP